MDSKQNIKNKPLPNKLSAPLLIDIKFDIEPDYKKIVIIGDELAGRLIAFNNMTNFFKGMKKTEKITKFKKQNLLNKQVNIQIFETTGYEDKTSKLDLDVLSSKII